MIIMPAYTHSEFHIEDARNHSSEAMATLHQLVERGAALHPDPKRVGFYEIRNEVHTFYIYVLPGSGTILLLAIWPNEDCRAGAVAQP